MNPPVTYIDPPGTAPAQGLYSHVGKPAGGGLVFIAGQLSVDTEGRIVGENDFAAQFDQVFKNLGDVLAGLGADFNHVVKFSTFFVHSQDIPTFMAKRQALFPTIFSGDKYPPNTILVVDRLVKEPFLLEVEAVAYLP
jgi:enamine deaminase RidA (YjgF/YER057c/UK114 family)